MSLQGFSNPVNFTLLALQIVCLVWYITFDVQWFILILGTKIKLINGLETANHYEQVWDQSYYLINHNWFTPTTL